MIGQRVYKTTVGLKINFGAAWIGFHWSFYNRRICINIVPFVTVWVAFTGGRTP